MQYPFSGAFQMTQDWNDPRYRSSYTKFGLLGHNGQDFGTPVGTPILSPHNGRVIESALDSTGYGNYVKIENDVEGSILGHFRELAKVKVGDYVEAGQLIAYSGNTGNSTGPHLHWGYYRFPRKRDNGFSGTVDQTHWMIIEDCQKIQQELEDMRTSRDKWKTNYTDLENKYEKEIASLTEHTQSLQKSLAEANMQATNLNQTIQTSEIENKRLREDFEALQGEFTAMTTNKDEDIAKLRDSLEEMIKSLEKCEELISKKVEEYSKWDLFLILLRRWF